MIKTTESIESVKQRIKSLYGKPVRVCENLGRNKLVHFTGVLDRIYPALFSVNPDGGKHPGKTAYSYSDALCGKVTVTLDEGRVLNTATKEGNSCAKQP